MNEQSELITIVTAAYNAEATITAAVNSVLRQTHANLELVVCDDASTDHTLQILRKFTDSRLRIVCNETNLGAGPARDRSISIAKGNWVTFLDADDAYDPRRLEKLLGVAKTHPGAIVFDELMECHDAPAGLTPWRRMRPLSAFPGPTNMVRMVRYGDWIRSRRLITFPLIPLCLVRKFKVHHALVDSGEDIAFRLALLSRSRAPLVYVPEASYLYRITAGSLSSRHNSTRLLINILKDAIPGFDWSPDTQAAIRTRIAMAERREIYLGFFTALMNKRLWRAGMTTARHPWVLGEFMIRAAKILPYHASRLRHGGAWKKKF